VKKKSAGLPPAACRAISAGENSACRYSRPQHLGAGQERLADGRL
jgi:hypothetical protein